MSVFRRRKAPTPCVEPAPPTAETDSMSREVRSLQGALAARLASFGRASAELRELLAERALDELNGGE